ncbi:carbohydrate sulfotransferase 15-like [Littorina saxatilis]|uniref:carbohydrate sulfotransferase 15-like n=1 Tax=Littorina saxatilis TaxID=31220 RepID=UPI0038B5A03A
MPNPLWDAREADEHDLRGKDISTIVSSYGSLVNSSNWRTVGPRHGADFVGDLPLAPPCDPRVPPGIPSWGKYGYIKRPSYINRSKNPCWEDEDCDRFVLCIPYFFILGVSKSGTSDLFHRISLHPDVIKTAKEPHFFARTRFSGFQTEQLEEPLSPTKHGSHNFSHYVNYFDEVAAIVQQDLEIKGFSQAIAGDASPSNFFDNDHWPIYAGNQGCTEPRVLAAHHILHLNPKAKVILIFRDPVERLYSRYLYYCGHRKSCYRTGVLGPLGFHRAVVYGLKKYRDCFRHWSLRHCVNKASLAKSVNPALRLQESIYFVFLKDWLRIVPRQQMHVIRFETYVSNMTSELKSVYSFLGLRKLSEATMRGITEHRVKNRGKFYKHGPMLSETRSILRTFYQPFTRRFKWLLRKHDLLNHSSQND